MSTWLGPAFKSTVNNSYQLAQKYIDQTNKNLITDSKFIRNYVMAERLIDRDIIQRFDMTSVKELRKHPDFSVKSPFEEEIGHQVNPANCSSCQSKGGAPMACYPCDNFRPLETANHQQYLDKAERKLALNSQSGHPATVNRLQTIIIYIRATISVCNEINTLKLRGLD